MLLSGTPPRADRVRQALESRGMWPVVVGALASHPHVTWGDVMSRQQRMHIRNARAHVFTAVLTALEGSVNAAAAVLEIDRSCIRCARDRWAAKGVGT